MTTADLPELNEENVAVGTPLRPYNAIYGAEEIGAFLSRTGETSDAYLIEGRVCVPPGILLGCYYRLIHESFRYQTGVHVSSDMLIHRLPWQDEPVRISGEVLDLFERRGNKQVRFSVNVTAQDGEALAAIGHVSIYKLKARDAGA